MDKIIVILLLIILRSSFAIPQEGPVDAPCPSDLKPQEPPRVICQGDGGIIEVWEGDTLQNANLMAARVTLRPSGLLLPSYIDAPTIKFVLQGSLRVGINNPWTDRATQENILRLKEGDLTAIPEGVANWWYNDGDEDAVILCIGDTTISPHAASEKVFLLAGGRDRRTKDHFGNILKGFSTKFLAQMWDIPEDMVRIIVNSQQQSGLIRIPKGMNLPDFNPESTTGLGMDFIYHYSEAYPDYKVDQGGELREINSLKMPILQSLKMSADAIRLLEDAIVGPNWSHNGHEVIYVQGGSGRLQVANHVGDRIFDFELQEGSLAVVPRFFPSTKVAGVKGMKYISVFTTDRPLVSFLGGYNSVYSGLPIEILSSAFNVDEETGKKLQQGRSRKAVIFPPKQFRRCESQPLGC